MQRSPLTWLMALMLLCAAAPARPAVLYTVDGEQLDCQWLGATADSITVAPTDPDQPPREVALTDVDRLVVRQAAVVTHGPVGPLIDNDGPHAMQVKHAKVKLRAGLHRFVVPFIQGAWGAGLELKISIPDKWTRVVAGPMLYHVPDGGPQPASPGVDEEGYRLPENPPNVQSQARYQYRTYDETNNPDYPVYVKQLPGLTLKNEGLAPQIGIGVADKEEGYGILFTGYIKIDQDGEYGFALSSDDGSQLYFGPTPAFLLDPTQSPPDDAANAAGAWDIDLADGGRVTGEIQKWDGSGLTVQVKIPGQDITLTIPAEHVQEVSRPDKGGQDNAPDTDGATIDKDTVFVANGEGQVQSVSGVVMGVDGDALLFRYGEQDKRIKLVKIVGITLARRAEGADIAGFYQVLGLTGGQSLAGHLLDASDARARLDTAWGQTLDLPISQITELVTRNGRLAYLSDMTPDSVNQTPYFDRMIPYRNDRSLTGDPIKLIGDDTTYDRGVSTHSRTILRYALGGRYTGFRCTVGLLEPDGAAGDVGVRVLGDGRVLFERSSLTADVPPIPLDLDVTGVDELTLETDYGKGQDVGDRVGWANARLTTSSDNP
jgi:NPCBM/NEW2 domain